MFAALHILNSTQRNQTLPTLDMKEISVRFSLVLYILTVVVGLTGNSVVIFVAGLKLKVIKPPSKPRQTHEAIV